MALCLPISPPVTAPLEDYIPTVTALHRSYRRYRRLTDAMALRLDRVRTRDSEFYRLLLQELLAWSAEAEDMACFSAVLLLARNWQDEAPHDRCFGFLRRWDERLSFFSFSVNECEELLDDYFCTSLMITSRRPYLDLLIHTLGVPLRCYDAPHSYRIIYTHALWHTYCTYRSTLPDYYLPVLAGDTESARALGELGALGRGYLEPWERQGSQCQLDGFSYVRLTSLLTAALQSNSKEMLELIQLRFPRLRYRREMLQPLCNADRAIQRCFLDSHPEFWQGITFGALLRYPRLELLERYLSRYGRLPGGAVLRCNTLHISPPPIPTLYSHHADSPIWRTEEYAPLYALMLAHSPDEGTYRANLRELLMMVAPPFIVPPDCVELLRRHFPPDTDVTPYLGPPQDQASVLSALVRVSSEDLETPLSFRLDLYQVDVRIFRRLDVPSPSAFFRAFRPTRILPRADQVTVDLLRLCGDDLPTVRLAIAQGYVSKVNAAFIPLPRERGGRTGFRRHPKPDPGALAEILALRPERTLSSRYSWNNETTTSQEGSQ